MHRPSPAPRWPFAARARSLLLLIFSASAVVGCDDAPPKAQVGATASALSSAPSAAASQASSAPVKPKSMPDLLVDGDGPYLAGTRINLAEPTGPERLVKVIKELPIDGKQVTLLVEKKAKISSVAAVVGALGDAGAPKVTIKTDGRDDLPKEIMVTPQERVTAPPSCAIATMVLKDLSTAIWPVKGGMGRRQRKGLAGPDLSHTAEQLTKDIASCDATVAFFSSDDAVPWESAFNLAGTVLNADEKKKIDTVVLLRDTPVAGRPVTLGKH